LDGGTLSTGQSSDSTQDPTPAESMDGDHVLIQFLDNDPSQPVIIPYQLAHPRSNTRLVKTDGRIRRIRHNGISIEWDKNSNLTIDARGAASDNLGPGGSEQSVSGTGGQIKILTSDGSNETSIHLDQNGQILFGSNTATPSDEPMVLGNLWISIMEELIDAIRAITVNTPSGQSTLPLVNDLTFNGIASKISNKLHVSDFIFGKKAP